MKAILSRLFYLFVPALLLQANHALSDEKILNVNGCLPHITCQREDVSRDYTCVDLTDNNSPCEFQGVAGGEHQTFIQVYGSYGEKFSISFTKLKGNPMFNISGENIELSNISESASCVFIKAKKTFFTIALSAHPYGEYQVNIKKYE